MTMVLSLRTPAAGRMRVAGMVWMATVLAAALAAAEDPPVHYLHAGAMPPGAIGSRQLQRGGPLPGYFQPVEIMAPEGAMVSLADGADFMRPHAGTSRSRHVDRRGLSAESDEYSPPRRA